MTTNRFHDAGKDGYLPLLKQATKKDLNRPDEGGMTPTLWTAYHGHLEALRTCCSRGGNPDMCDLRGNTALHFAAKKGFTRCLMFLVTFGANLWQMDNDFHSPMDSAAMHENRECMQYLDGAIIKQESLDKKRVKKLQEEARKEAERRCKKYQKVIEAMGAKQAKPYETQTRNQKTPSATFSRLMGPKTATEKKKSKLSSTVNSKAASDPGFMFGGETLTGIPSQQSGVMYVGTDTMNRDQSESRATSNRKMLRDVFNPNEVNPEDPLSRPNFNSMALRSSYQAAKSMYSAIDNFSIQEQEDSNMPTVTKPDLNHLNGYNYNDEYSGNGFDHNLSSDDEYEVEATPLDTFLASLNLSEYSNLFKDEKMDMDALFLCSMDDLKEMGLPLGPRKKIIGGLEERKAVIHSPQDMELTKF